MSEFDPTWGYGRTNTPANREDADGPTLYVGGILEDDYSEDSRP